MEQLRSSCATGVLGQRYLARRRLRARRGLLERDGAVHGLHERAHRPRHVGLAGDAAHRQAPPARLRHLRASCKCYWNLPALAVMARTARLHPRVSATCTHHVSVTDILPACLVMPRTARLHPRVSAICAHHLRAAESPSYYSSRTALAGCVSLLGISIGWLPRRRLGQAPGCSGIGRSARHDMHAQRRENPDSRRTT